MPRKAPMRMRRKSVEDLVNSYGFSLQSIDGMVKMTPFLPMSKAVNAWAKFLLAAESREEARWLPMGIPLLEDHYKKKVVLCKPKAIAYMLPGTKYTPDFLYIFEDGMRLNVEVKGSQFQKGYKDAIARMKIAATLYWFDRFMLVMPTTGVAWSLKEMPPDDDYQTELQALAADVTIMIAENEGG